MTAAISRPSLDNIRTDDDHEYGRSPDAWTVRLWPDVGEAIIVPRWETNSSNVTRRGQAHGTDFDSVSANRLRSVRRAKAGARRYSIANRLLHMWTLTYRDSQCDWGAAGADCARFIRRLRRRVEVGPYLWVRETHKNPATGLHIHLLLSERLQHRQVEAVWGRGWVDVREFRSGTSQSAGERAAGYVSKGFESLDEDLLRVGTERPKWGQFYVPAPNFNPTVVEYATLSR